MATTISFNLSTILSGNLSGSSNGANVYAFAYDSGVLVQTASMLIDGSTVGTTPTLTLDRIANGKIYVVVQEQGTAGGIADVASATGIDAVGFFTPGNAQTYNFRYDLLKLNLQSNPADVADISDINQFGMPITLTVNGQTRGFKVSGDTIAANIAAQTPSFNGSNIQDQSQFQFDPATPLSGPRDTIVPGNNIVWGSPSPPGNGIPNPFPGADWTQYVKEFKNHVGAIELLSTFDGVPAKNLKGSLSDYLVEYDSTTDVFWLHPNPETEHLPGMTTGWIKIPAAELIDNIYLQTGQLQVYLDGKDGHHVKTYTDSFTPNNAWGDLSKVFVAGFDAGFWGSTGVSPNTGAGGTFDLDHTWNWNAAYAYGAALGEATYTRDWGAGGAGQPGQNNRYYDPFGAEFFKNSNAYGYSYTDLISNGGGVSPAIPVANAQGVNVSAIDVMLWDRSETPTGWTSGNSGYLAGPYAPANTVNGSNYFQFDFHFGLNGQTYAPDNETPIVFKFYDPTATAATGGLVRDGFVWFTLPKNDWFGYTINQSGTTYSMTPNGSSGQVGLFFLSGVPVASGSGISWYQLLLGDANDYTTFNFYATVDGSNIMNNAVIDHGVTVTSMAPASGYKFVFADGGTMHYDIRTFLAPTAGPPGGAPPQPAAPGFAPPEAAPPPAPAAPVIGTLVNGIFVQIGDASHLKQGELAFSFTTEGNGNTLIPGHIAKIDLGNVLHSDWILSPVVTMAGFDGDWTTKLSSQFGNGTFSAVLNQYAQNNFALDHATYSASTTLTFTVELDTLALGTAAGGQALALSQGSSPTLGNWIELSTVGSTLINSTLVIYATDANGNMLARDGATLAATLDDAALARLGSVASDDRSTVFFSGKQFVYLPVGEQLHFAIVSGDGQVDTHPRVNISGSGNLFGVTVGDGFGTLNLTASVNNDLDKAAALAAGQRLSDHPWTYLKQDAKLGVDLAWSGDYVNTLHFVRIDIDPTDASKWKVGGVDYGNTDAFRAAVQANWEFSATQGHSAGSSSTVWTVKGGSGFYAPVLVNPDGDIWMVNQSPTRTANADGHQHIRDYGQSTFGFEDVHAAKGADFDYNDMVMHLWLV